MSEYINKQQAIDLMASMIAERGHVFNPYKLVMVINDFEGVEIVRCKECKYWQEDEKFCDNEFGMYVHTRADDFCFQGKRKLNNPDDSLVTEDSEACKEQKSKLESDLISRQAAIDAVTKYFIDEYDKMPYEYDEEVKDNVFTDMKWVDISLEHNKEIRKVLKSLPPVEPPKKVVAQIKVDTEEIVKRIKEEYEIKDRPVCDDSISRADTLKALCAECDVKCEDGADKEAYCTEYAVVKSMPPVEPKQSELHIDEPRGYTLKTDKAKAYSERPKGECRTCKRCSDHCCETDDDFTRCPIEEHYRLPKDGYCHLYDPIWR